MEWKKELNLFCNQDDDGIQSKWTQSKTNKQKCTNVKEIYQNSYNERKQK